MVSLNKVNINDYCDAFRPGINNLNLLIGNRHAPQLLVDHAADALVLNGRILFYRYELENNLYRDEIQSRAYDILTGRKRGDVIIDEPSAHVTDVIWAERDGHD